MRTSLRSITQGLLVVARAIGRAQAGLVLTLFYFFILGPAAMVFNCVADPLRIRRAAQAPWQPSAAPRDPWQWARRQS